MKILKTKNPKTKIVLFTGRDKYRSQQIRELANGHSFCETTISPDSGTRLESCRCSSEFHLARMRPMATHRPIEQS